MGRDQRGRTSAAAALGSMTVHAAPPYDPSAELAALGVALDTAWAGPRPDLDPGDFYVPAHRALWEAIAGLTKPIRPADLPEDLRPLARTAVRSWLPAHAQGAAAATVRRHAAARRAIAAAHDIAEAARAVDVDQAARLAHRLADELDAA